MSREIAIQLVKEYESEKADKATWTEQWDEVAKFGIPRKDDVYGGRPKGEKDRSTLFTSFAIWCVDFLSAALHGLLTNPASVWFGMTSGMRKVDSIDKVRIWLDQVVEMMIGALNDSNFQTEVHETYYDITSFGTNILQMEEDEEDIINFESIPVYLGTIQENSKGDVVGVSREFDFDLLQIFEKFGDIPDEVKRELGDDTKKKFKIVHRVKPVSQAKFLKQLGDKVPMGMEYVSFYILTGSPYILSTEFFNEFPYAVPRWTKSSGEKYGRSPLMKALAEVKMQNSMKKVTIQGAQLAIAPPVETPDNGFLRPLTLKPFGVNYKRSTSRSETRTIFNGTRPDIGLDMINDSKEDIKQHFYIDQLKLIISDRMTATEVNHRRDEQLRSLGPILGRLHRELLKPIINRLFGIMLRRGLFPPVPQELIDAMPSGKLKIKYKSAIAKAQMTSEAYNVSRAVEATGPVLQTQPEALDWIDGSALLKYNLGVFGAPAEVIRTKSKVDEIQRARMEAMKEQQESDTTMQDAEVVNKIKGA